MFLENHDDFSRGNSSFLSVRRMRKKGEILVETEDLFSKLTLLLPLSFYIKRSFVEAINVNIYFPLRSPSYMAQHRLLNFGLLVSAFTSKMH